jgi:phage gp16-like protein
VHRRDGLRGAPWLALRGSVVIHRKLNQVGSKRVANGMEKGRSGEPAGDYREQGWKQQKNKKHAKQPHIKSNDNAKRKVPGFPRSI